MKCVLKSFKIHHKSWVQPVQVLKIFEATAILLGDATVRCLEVRRPWSGNHGILPAKYRSNVCLYSWGFDFLFSVVGSLEYLRACSANQPHVFGNSYLEIMEIGIRVWMWQAVLGICMLNISQNDFGVLRVSDCCSALASGSASNQRYNWFEPSFWSITCLKTDRSLTLFMNGSTGLEQRDILEYNNIYILPYYYIYVYYYYCYYYIIYYYFFLIIYFSIIITIIFIIIILYIYEYYEYIYINYFIITMDIKSPHGWTEVQGPLAVENLTVSLHALYDVPIETGIVIWRRPSYKLV
jgi:hypothetical protein